jgi:hypothetical protein
MVKAIFGAKFYDMILKFKLENDEETNSLKTIQEFETEMLKEGYILEHEISPNGSDCYVKVITPFILLAEQAERIGLRFELLVNNRN